MLLVPKVLVVHPLGSNVFFGRWERGEIFLKIKGGKDDMGKNTLPVSKWLITMVIVSPLSRVVGPLPNRINGVLMAGQRMDMGVSKNRVLFPQNGW